MKNINAVKLGKLGRAKNTESQQAASRENGKLGGAPKKAYYLLSGEGSTGTWSGPIITTGRAIRMRQNKEKCGGDQWCRVFELCKEFVIDIENNETRDIPEID